MTVNTKISSFIERYGPSLLVLLSQVVAAVSNAAAKFIETGSEPVHPFMILHIRMLITGLGCTLYLWHSGISTSEVFFGSSDVRQLVLLRAIGGVCGATGFFFSMIYLSLSEATALNFLGPLGSLILTRCLSFPTARWNDCIGALGALLGVIFVAQPESIFGKRAPTENGKIENKSVHGHLKGLAFGIFGVFGGVIALASIRRIGKRVHPLTIFNMFSWTLVFVSGSALLMIPGIQWPRSPFVWACLISIGICGFVMEYLLTLGLTTDSSSTSTLMIYSQILWALAIDRILFDITANTWALLGSATIICSLCVVTVVEQGRKSSGNVYTHLEGGEEECAESLGLGQLYLEAWAE